MAQSEEFETRTSTTYNNNLNAVRRVSWGAVFAGLVIGLAVQLLLSLLGVAVGASTIDPLRGDTPGKGIAVGAGIWLLISGLISTYIGACTAGYLSGAARKSDRMLHGVLSWGVAALVTAFLLTSAVGSLIGGAMRVVGQAAGGATQAIAQSADAGRVRAQVNASANTQSAGRDAQQAVGGTGEQGGQFAGTSAQAEEKAREAGDTAAKATAGAAWWSFAMLLLGLLAAAMGGANARRYGYGATRMEEAPAR